MFRSPKYKLESLVKAIINNGRYIEKYDALNISNITFDDNSNDNSNIKMEGLRKLVTEIRSFLDEAYIEQQSVLADIKAQLQSCESDSKKVIKTLRPSSVEPAIPSEGLLVDVEGISDAIEQQDLLLNASKANILDIQLKKRLQDLYNQVQRIIDTKLAMLETIQEVSDVYIGSVIAIANSNGVIKAHKKATQFIKPKFKPLVENRFFKTDEESEILSSIRSVWALLLLQSRSHQYLAERQLSNAYCATYHVNSHWQQHIKTGAVLVLLLWAISECFNNESNGREIWRDLTFSIFMCFGDLFLLLMMWGVSIRVWRSVGIDYMNLLELGNTEFGQSSGYDLGSFNSANHNKDSVPMIGGDDSHAVELSRAGAANYIQPEEMVFASATDLVVVYLLSFISFNKVVRSGFFGHNNLAIAHAIPTCFVLYCFLRIVYPLATRKKWLFMLWRVVAAPSFAVSFRDGYIGDLLTSLVRVLIPLCFSIVYVVVSFYSWFANDLRLITTDKDLWWTDSWLYRLYLVPLMTLLPLWLRLMQCLRRSVETGQRWPHMGNALKYTSAIVAIAYGTYQPDLRQDLRWVSSLVFATCYQFTWDLTMDWGMIGLSSASHIPVSSSSGIAVVDYLVNSSLKFRQLRLLGPIWVYILVIFSNFLLRFAWTLTLLPTPSPMDSHVNPIYASLMMHLAPVLAAAEIMRRMVWGFFRLEWEQIEKLSHSKSDAELEKMDVCSGVEMQSIIIDSAQTKSLDRSIDHRVTGSVDSNHVLIAGGGVNASAIDSESDVDSSDLEDASMRFSQSSSRSWTEADWTWLLPTYVQRSIYNASLLPSIDSKLRFIESVVFVILLLLVLFHAAWPAFVSDDVTARRLLPIFI